MLLLSAAICCASELISATVLVTWELTPLRNSSKVVASVLKRDVSAVPADSRDWQLFSYLQSAIQCARFLPSALLSQGSVCRED